MGAHIFLVGQDNFDICVRRGVYGCVEPSTEWNRAEVVAGISSIQPDDLVFFYVKNRGIYGVWKVASAPYHDTTAVWASKEQSYPYRFSFDPTIGCFPTPIALYDVLDLHDKGRVWTFDLNPVQQKNQYKITMEEARELLRLLLRNNPIRGEHTKIVDPYVPESPQRISIDLSRGKGGCVRYEGWLNAWFVRCLANGELRTVLGDYHDFINLVPTTFNRVMDVFLTHVTRVDSFDILHKFTCIELKAERAAEQDLTQLLRYGDWLARKLAAGDYQMIQAVLVARRFSDAVIEYVRNRRRIEEKSIRLVTYRVVDGTNIELQEVQ